MLHPFNNACLVVAHPDDEVLWFSSVLTFLEKIIICFVDYPPKPDWSRGRRAVIKDHPIKNTTSLYLTESGSFEAASWPDPPLTKQGLYIENEIIKKKYEQNYYHLTKAFCKQLSGYDVVLSHNPWGEYGHEDHIQVFHALKTISKKVGFELWVTNYCSNRSMDLASRYQWRNDNTNITLPVNHRLVGDIKSEYEKNKCWSWFDDWRWPETETFRAVKGLVPCESFHRVLPDYHYINFN